MSGKALAWAVGSLSLLAIVIIIVVVRGAPDGPNGGRSGDESAGGNRFLSGGSIAGAWANDGGDKVVRRERRAAGDTDDVRNSVWDGNRVSIFGARNEVVSFNVVLEAPSETNVNEVTVTLDALTASDGTEISAPDANGDRVFDWVGRNIELFYVRYLQIVGLSSDIAYDDYDERHIPDRLRRPWIGPGYAKGRWVDRPNHDAFYPEIAVPLELVGAFDIARGQNQSIWVDVYIPEDATPGVYRGTMLIAERGRVSLEIPVQLTVRDFMLPDFPTARTMVFLSYENINVRYTGEKYPEAGSPHVATSRSVRDRHFQLAHRHRISLIDANDGAGAFDRDEPRPEWLPRLDGRLFSAGQGYDGPGENTPNDVFSIGTYGTWAWQDDGEAGMREHTDAWVEWFEANAPDTDYFLYLIDEPPREKWAQVEQWARWINDNPGPGSSLKSLVTIGLPDARRSTPSVDIAAGWTTPSITDEWQHARDQLAADPDKRVYMYNGVRPYSGSFAIEDHGVALRELAWGQYKKGVDRWFYWDATYYKNYVGGAGQTNVFKTAQTFGAKPVPDKVRGQKAWNYCNGEGVLFYPGTDTVYPQESYGVVGPFASLRLKHWRRGIQDVDYLVMAAKIKPDLVAEIVERIVPKVLWEYGVAEESDPTWVRTDISWTNDPDVWEAARRELADIIESGN